MNTIFPASSPIRSRSGFTLVEILTVILIIVTLVGLVVGVAQLAHGKGAEGQCRAELLEWKKLLDTHWEHEGDYPADGNLRKAGTSGLVTYLNQLKNGSVSWENAGLNMNKIKTRDPWGSEYVYRRVSKERYQLGSLGPDRKFGDNALAANGDETNARKLFGEGDDITNDNGRLN